MIRTDIFKNRNRFFAVAFVGVVFVYIYASFWGANLGSDKMFLGSGDIVHSEITYYLTNYPNTFIDDGDLLWVTGHSKLFHFTVALFNNITGLVGPDAVAGLYLVNTILLFLSTNILLFLLIKKTSEKLKFKDPTTTSLVLIGFFNLLPFTVPFFVVGDQSMMIFSTVLLFYSFVRFKSPNPVMAVAAAVLFLNGSFHLYLMFVLWLMIQLYKGRPTPLLTTGIAALVSSPFLIPVVAYNTSIDSRIIIAGIIGLIVASALAVVMRNRWSRALAAVAFLGISVATIYVLIPTSLNPLYNAGTLWASGVKTVGLGEFVAQYHIWGFLSGWSLNKEVVPIPLLFLAAWLYFFSVLLFFRNRKKLEVGSMEAFLWIGVGIVVIEFLLMHIGFNYFRTTPLSNFYQARISSALHFLFFAFSPLLVVFVKRIPRYLLLLLIAALVTVSALQIDAVTNRHLSRTIESHFNSLNNEMCVKNKHRVGIEYGARGIIAKHRDTICPAILKDQ